MPKEKKNRKASSPKALSQQKTITKNTSANSLKPGMEKLHPVVFILCAVVIIYFSIVFYSLYTRHIYLEMKEPTDSAGFIQGSWSVLKGTPFTNTTQEYAVSVDQPHNMLSVALCLTPALFAPIFLFTSSAVSFLIMQALIVSLAAIPLFLFAERKLKDKWLALAISIVYLFNPATYESFEKFGFRPETLFIPVLFAMFYFLEKDQYWGAGISLVSALFIKHNMIMMSFMLGLYYLIFERRRQRFGIFCLVVAVLYYLIGIRMVLHHFQTSEVASFRHFAAFGKTPQEALINMLLNPGKIIGAISPLEWKYSYRIFFPAGLLALLHPVFWACLPQLVMNAILRDYHSVYCAWHWAVIVPFIFVGTVYTMKWILNKFHQNTYITYIFFAMLFVSLYYNLIDFNKTALAADTTYYYKQKNIDTTKIIDRLSIIEPDASVMVSGQLLWFFAAREHVYNAWVKFHDEVEYIAILLPMGQPGYGNIDRHMLIETQNPNSKYLNKFRVISKDKHLVILKNKNAL